MNKLLKIPIYAMLLGTLSFLFSCQDDDDEMFLQEGEVGEISALPATVAFPGNNPNSATKIELGRALFWDPILSGTMDVACATCHHPDFGYADGRDLSSGVNGAGLGPNRVNGIVVKRNSPTVLNTAFNGINQDGNYDPNLAPMFWDNRASGLEEQALLPILSAEEMRGNAIAEADILNVIVQRLQAEAAYRQLFADAFGSQVIDANRIAAALATFQRSIIANNSPFDQYMRGDLDALTGVEIAGMNEFLEAGCANCHGGPMLSDFQLHTLSVPEHPLVEDTGATGNFDFRTPSLRNLAFTAPYMHNGRFDDLEEVLEFYDDISRGNGDSRNPNIADNQIAEEAVNLQFNRGDINEIVAFLNALNDPNFDRSIPQSVPSGLPVGGDIE